jgi:hypothetical protein
MVTALALRQFILWHRLAVASTGLSLRCFGLLVAETCRYWPPGALWPRLSFPRGVLYERRQSPASIPR